MDNFEIYFRLPKAERERMRKAILALMRAGVTFEQATTILLAASSHYSKRFPYEPRVVSK